MTQTDPLTPQERRYGRWRNVQDQRWKSFEEAVPPPNMNVLVTNNIKARDTAGQMSHVWVGWPQQSSGPNDSFPNKPPKGSWLCYSGDREVQNLTHWHPLPPPPPEPSE